jgi:hypothetical protein
MSPPRLDAEQKKVSFSLAFSPNLIAALEKVRGAKSPVGFCRRMAKASSADCGRFGRHERSWVRATGCAL